MNTNTRAVRGVQTRYLTELALMIAVILLMSFTPLGYIRTPGLEITLLTVPVAVGAILLGPAGGAVCGAAFGLTSFYQCFSSTFGAALLSINPFFTFVNAVVTRTLVGWLTGLLYRALSGGKTRKFACYLAALACPLLNTLLFMGALVLFFYRTDYIQSLVTALGATNPFIFVLAFVGAQGALEALICFLLASAISRALLGALRRQRGAA